MTSVDVRYNKLLLKQIQKKFGNPEDLPTEVLELLNSISYTYDTFERERQLIERSMDLSSNELMDANAKLEQQAQKLQRSNEELREFAFAVSHDLKEPLRTIASYIQLIELRLKSNLDSETKDFMGFAVSGVRRLQHMLDGMLKYSQLEEGRKEFTRQDLNLVLELAMENLKETISLNEAVVNVRDSLPTVTGNRVQLIQLFQNIIANSIKFRNDEKPTIDIYCKNEPGGFLFSVIDNGIGIYHSEKHNLFSLFRRGHNGNYEGVGMGLSICKKIIENHGGSIRIDGHESRGCKVEFVLPG